MVGKDLVLMTHEDHYAVSQDEQSEKKTTTLDQDQKWGSREMSQRENEPRNGKDEDEEASDDLADSESATSASGSGGSGTKSEDSDEGANEDDDEKEGKLIESEEVKNSNNNNNNNNNNNFSENCEEEKGYNSSSTEQKSCSAKVENGRRIPVQMGTSSENSIKTTPDTSLESQSHPSNLDSSSLEVATIKKKGKEGGASSSLSPKDKTSKVSGSTKDSSSPAKSTEHNVESLGSTNSIDRGSSLNIRALPFESGINTECIQLLRQLWNLHDESLQFLHSIQRALNSFRRWLRTEDNEHDSSLWDKKRHQGMMMLPTTVPLVGVTDTGEEGVIGGGPNEIRWIPLQLFVDGLKVIADNVSEIEKQCLNLSVFQSQCKLVLFAKIRHAKRQVTHDRLAILHHIHQLIVVTTQLLASPSFWLSPEVDIVSSYAFSVFHLSEMYNASLESCWTHVEASLAATNPSLSSTPSITDSASEMGTSVSLSKIRILTQVRAANMNDAPLLRQSLKPVTATKLLQVIAQRRATFCSFEFTRTTLTAFYENRKESSSVSTSKGLEKLTQCLDEESVHMMSFEKAFSKKPSLLGRAAVKESENGEFRLTKSFKRKMYGYFHEVLWSLVGEYSEDLMLWSLQAAIPLTLHSGETQIALRRQLMLWSHAQARSPTPLLPAFEAIAGALHSFSLMVNWDEKMRDAFELTYKVKRPEHVTLVSKPEAKEMATDVGRNFGEIMSSCIALMESGNTITNRMSLPLEERQKLASLFGEEEPLGDEAQILFRLDATLNYFRAWTVRRAKVWLNSWAVPQFIACSQRDPALLVELIKSKEVFLITREALLKSDNIPIRIGAKNRHMCAEDMRKAIASLQKVPDELLVAVGIVCRTLSLATLKTYMPEASHWRGSGKGSGLDPDRPSPYVRIFIDRVVAPVFRAAVNLVPPVVQESLGKQTINAMCDAWLHFILQRKIKFGEWGAVQLLRDFVSLREWIKNETELDKDARKAILHLEVLKSCEGVAYLLLRNPGDVLGVGKPSRKSRRVAPASEGSVESSPAPSEGSSAEDDIPPEMYVPNQQMWLQLRLKKSAFPTCCNF